MAKREVFGSQAQSFGKSGGVHRPISAGGVVEVLVAGLPKVWRPAGSYGTNNAGELGFGPAETRFGCVPYRDQITAGTKDSLPQPQSPFANAMMIIIGQ